MNVTIAESLARELHKFQRYTTPASNRPYSEHLEDVVAVLGEFNVHDEDIIAAAWLHDAVEDTEADVDFLLAQGIPLYVVALVDAVTDRPGSDRHARHALTYPRIARIPDAVTLKLSDRIANARVAKTLNPRLLSIYRKEHTGFRAALNVQGPTHRHAVLWAAMWTELHRVLEDFSPPSPDSTESR